MSNLLNTCKRLVAGLTAGLALAMAGEAAAQNLQISGFGFTPTNPADAGVVVNGAETTFKIDLANYTETDAPAGAVVTIQAPTNFEIDETVPSSKFPSYCVLSGTRRVNQVLTCTLPDPVPANGAFSFEYKAIAVETGAEDWTATLAGAPPPPATTRPTVRSGANLSVIKTDDASGNIPAGGTLTYTIQAQSEGPNATDRIRVTDVLPAASDLEFLSVDGGADWACGPLAGRTLTCDYTGPAVGGAPGAPVVLPAIQVRGRVVATEGAINNTASVLLTDPDFRDPDEGDNSSTARTNIRPGADIAADKVMPPVLLVGDEADIQLTVRHRGGALPVPGATVTDTIAANFQILSVPAPDCVLQADGRTVTCTSPRTLNAGESETFAIRVQAISPTGGGVSNTATATSPAGIADPDLANNTKSVTYRIDPPNADLSLQKSKGPNPVREGEEMTSTIRVRNNGPLPLEYSAAEPLVVVDELAVGEDYVGYGGAGWVCALSGRVVTCRLDGPGTLAASGAGSYAPDLILTTLARSSTDANLRNVACTGQTARAQAGTDGALPDINADNDCASAGSRSTPYTADLRIIKDVGPTAAGPWSQAGLTIPDAGPNSDAFFVRLRVSNADGGDVARTVTVRDELPNAIHDVRSGLGLDLKTGFAVDSYSAGPDTDAPQYDEVNGVITWQMRDLAAGAANERFAILRISRPFEAGSFTNVATVSSIDTVEPATPEAAANNRSTADYTVAPIADIAINAKTITPTVDAAYTSAARAGVVSTYNVTVRSLGPSPAANVVVTDRIDTSIFELVGAPSLPAEAGAVCRIIDDVAPFKTIECVIPSMARGATWTIEQQVRPRFPADGAFAPFEHTNRAEVTTDTTETTTANNSRDLQHWVLGPDLDLIVLKNEPSPSTDYDPAPFGVAERPLEYEVTVSNQGPSRATHVRIRDIPEPPAGEPYTMTLRTAPGDVQIARSNPAGAVWAPVCVADGAGYVCKLNSDDALNWMPAGASVTLRLKFDVAHTDGVTLPSGALRFNNRVEVTSAEQPTLDPKVWDRVLGNNSDSEPTTVLPATDLRLDSKTVVTADPIALGQPVQYSITLSNHGPSPTGRIRVTDALPSGWTFASELPVTAVPAAGSAATVSSVNCSGTQNIVCDLAGVFPAAASQVVLTLSARTVDPYPASLGLCNVATVAPGRGDDGGPVSVDPDRSNNSNAAAPTCVAAPTSSSISGSVKVNDTGRAGVTVTLAGTDAWGNPVASRTATTDASGNFTFDRLPPGTYTLVETQPAGTLDFTEVVGTHGGAVSPDYSGGAADNTIREIKLLGPGDTPVAQAATGYVFNNLTPAKVSGYIYRDLNNNGLREPGETGFAPGDFDAAPHVRLTGTDYAGAVLALAPVSVDANGFYEFTNVPPSNAAGYVVTQLVQPRGVVDGLDANGLTAPGVAAVLAGSAGRAAPEDLPIGEVKSDDDLTERNFGELATSTLGGMVFFDPDGSAVRPGSPIGLPGARVTLTGTDDRGQAVNCQVTTDANGLYAFPPASGAAPGCEALRPGTYALTVTPAPGFTHTGAFIGALGGTSGGITGADTPAPGAANTAVTAVTVRAGDAAANYDFGGTGQGLSGYVYIDTDRSGARDAGEAGIAGVTITLSGLTATGQNVCDLISCAAVTDATGAFAFPLTPGSNAAGYTLTQQPQSSPPLSMFADGRERAGTVLGVVTGVAGDDVISGIVLGAGQFGVNYAFGEWAGSLAGSVYGDANDDGVRQPEETGIAGVTVTLSGTSAQGEAITRTAVTDADGRYVFDDLPAGTYALVETQPAAYDDGRETAGTAGGVVNNAVFDASAAANTIGAIALGAGTQATGYDFGERVAEISGRVFKDPERDGVDAGGEPPIAGVTVELVQGGVVVATAVTDADGRYSFPGLPGGAYVVREVQPAGYGSSSPNEVAVNLAPGGAASVDFADTVSSLSGHVFVDTNNDGVRQAGEAPIAGVTIALTGTDATGAAVSRTTTTDANGDYRFDDLLSGTYVLTETQPEGYADGLDSAGSHGGVVDSAADRISAIALPEGVDAVDYAFGERGQGIGGRVYVDVNLDGVNDEGDRPLAGVTIELRTATGELVATTTTGADGSYSFGDLRTGDYVIVEIQPEGYGEGPENPTNRVPFTVTPDRTPDDINFGERTGSLSGLVYNDTNNNGRREANEPGIGGVLLTLTGTSAHGEPITRTAVSEPDGTYRFGDVPGGVYTVTETQPEGYDDGIDTPGTAGGVSDGGDAITGIAMPPATDATGYLFGERGAEASLSGSVWLDSDHDRARDPGEAPQAGWTVELFLNDTPIATTQTGVDGGYAFTGLAPGHGYKVRFRHPQNNAVFGDARPNETGADFVPGVISPSNPGGATLVDRELTGITLAPGGHVPQQSLPLDPWGVVYDAVRRTPVAGATVEITGPAGFDPAVHLLGGAVGARQVTDAQGLYQFQLADSAPAGTYHLAVTPPNGAYNPVQPSTIIPPCPGPLTVNATPAPLLVSTSDGPPPAGTPAGCVTGVMTTGYVLSLNLTPGVSANVVNNNIPLDPILEGALEVTKTTPMTNVVRGGLVPYAITARNTLAAPVTGVTLTDRIPAGFRYRSGSARIDGVAAEPAENGRVLTWPDLTFAGGETKRLELVLVVGSGVTEGEHTNVAFVVNPIVNEVISNLAEATVRLIPDADFDCADILGTVFDDRNGNGVQDDGEPGLPGVRLATARGLLITTDAEGRYHITCPMIPNEERGSNFIVKLDDRTLPTGYRITSANPETVRLTRGKFARLNFGAGLHRVVRVDLNADAFDDQTLGAAFEARLDGLIATLAERPSVLRLAYGGRGEPADLIARRLADVRRRIQDRWDQERGRYRLVVEQETVIPSAHQEGGVR